MAILVEALWKAAAAAEAAEAAEPPKRRCGRGRGRGRGGLVGRPRKVMALTEEPEKASQSVALSEAVIAASTAPASAPMPQAPLDMANGGVPGAAAPMAGQEGAAPSAAHHARLMVPRDSDSELDICGMPDGLPPLLQPSRLSNPSLAAVSRDDATAMSQPVSMNTQDGVSEPAAPAEQPGAITTGHAASNAAPESASTRADMQTAPAHLPPALAAVAPPQNVAAGALQQNGVPGLLAAGLTGLLAADPSMLAAIAAGASQFLMQAQQQASAAGYSLAAAAALPVVSGPLHVEPVHFQGSSLAPKPHPQTSQVASKQAANLAPSQQQMKQATSEQEPSLVPSQQQISQAASQQEPDEGPSLQQTNQAAPQQAPDHALSLQQVRQVASQQGQSLASSQQQPFMAPEHQGPDQAPPADSKTNGVSEPASAMKMVGKRASGKLLKEGAILDSVVVSPEPAAETSSPFLQGIKREMAAHVQQQAAEQETAVGVMPSTAAATPAAVDQQLPHIAHVAAVPAQQTGPAAEAVPMEIAAVPSGVPEQGTAAQVPATNAAPAEAVQSSGAALGDGATVLVAPDEGAPMDSPPTAPPLSIEEAREAIGRPLQPSGAAPEGHAATLVVCAGCCQRRHLACVPAAEHELARQGAWYHSGECRAADAELARLAASGLMPVQAANDSAADVSAPAWQLIRGAAVSAPEGCRGLAPRYDEAAMAQLRGVLYAARHILAESTGGLPDSRTGKDLLPLLLQGAVLPKKQRLVDFSRFHIATLWLGPTLAAAGLVRTHGAEVAEVPVLAVRPELEGNGLGRALLAQLESALLAAGVKLLVMPAVSQLPPTATSQGEVPQQWWPRNAGYAPASARQLARLSALPLLHFPAAPFLAKHLSADTLLKATVPAELKMSDDVDLASLVKAKLLSPVPLSFYEAAGADLAQAEGQPEALETAAVAIAEDSGGVKLIQAPANAADALQVQAGPADVSADVATDVSADGNDVAVRRENDATAAVTPEEDTGTPLESAAAERKSEGGEDALVAGTTGEAVLLGVEGIQNAESVPEPRPEAAPKDVVGSLSEPAVPVQE